MQYIYRTISTSDTCQQTPREEKRAGAGDGRPGLGRSMDISKCVSEEAHREAVIFTSSRSDAGTMALLLSPKPLMRP